MTYKIILLSILMIFSTIAFAQNEEVPEPNPPGNPPPPGLVVPIDENTHLLAVAGIFLGIFLLKKKKD